MSTAEIGDYEILLFISGLVCSFWINGLIQSFLPLYNGNKIVDAENSKKSPELFNAFILISLFSIIAVILLLIFRDLIESSFNNSTKIKYFKPLLLYILFSSPAYLTEYIYLLKNKPLWILYYGFLSFFLHFIVISVPALLGLGMNICIAGLVTISFLRYVWLLYILRIYALQVFSISFLKEHLRFGYPLMASALLGSSAQYVDGFLVLNKFDSATFAIFQYGAREFPLVLLMANALSTAMIPEFSSPGKLKISLPELKKKSGKLMHLLFPATIALLLTSNWLYPRIFNENFTASARIFNIYLLLISSRLIFPQTIIIGLKKTRIILIASVLELSVNIILSILFIHLWGIEGVAFATLIAFALQKAIWLYYNKNNLNIRIDEYIPVRMLIIYSIILLTVFYFVY